MKLNGVFAIYAVIYKVYRWAIFCKKSLLTFALLPLFCVSSNLALADVSEAKKPELKVGVSGRPIFQYVDESGQFAGLDVELSKLIFREAGFEIRFIFYPWTRILHLVELGELDVALSAADSEERRKYAHFSTQALRLGHNVFYTSRSKQNKFQSMERLSQLKGTAFRMAVLRGAAYSFEYEALMDTEWFSNNLVFVDSPQRTLDMLAFGRVDAFIGSEYSVFKWAQDIGYAEQLVPLFRLMSDSEAETHIMYSKKSVPMEWVNKVDAAMKRLKASGEYEQKINAVLGIATPR